MVISSPFTDHDENSALLHFRTPPRVRVRATVKLSAAFFHDESSITTGGEGFESAIAPRILEKFWKACNKI